MIHKQNLWKAIVSAKKAPQKVLFQKWCAIVYDYVRALHTAHRKRPAPPSILRRTFPALRFRTKSYDEYRQIEYKLELNFIKN